MQRTKFAQVLKKLRAERCMTQAELAEELSVSRSAVAGYEARNNQPDYETLVKLAEFFNVSIDYLLSGRSNHFPKTADLQYEEAELEKRLLRLFHALPYEAKHSVVDYAEYQKER